MSPRAEERRENAWCQRHHVVCSRGNIGVPKNRRAYFDHLPAVRVKEGELSDVLVVASPGCEDVREHKETFDRRICQFPQFWKNAQSALGSSKSSAWESYGSPDSFARCLIPPQTPPSRRPSTWSSAPSDDAAGTDRTASPRLPQRPPGSLSKPAYVRPDLKHMLDPRARTPVDMSSSVGSTCCPSPLSDPGLNSSWASTSGGASTPGGPGSSSPSGFASPKERQNMFRRGSALTGRKSRIRIEESTMEVQNREMKLVGFEDGSNDEMRRFLEWAHKHHRHLVCLWHKLDDDKSMLLHKNEFSAGLRRLHYGGNIDKLWNALDRDTTGNISFIEFCPESALEVARFKRWCDSSFGSAKDLFVALDTDKSGSVTFQEFSDTCAKLHMPEKLQGSIQTLFLLLDYDENETITTKRAISPAEISFLDIWKPPAYLWEEPDETAMMDFKDALLSRHNDNPLVAWRRALDKDSSMRVSFEEFLIQCKLLAKRGIPEAEPECGPTAIYAVLDEFRCGWFTLQSWDKDAFDVVHKFAVHLRDNFKNSAALFLKDAESWDDDCDETIVGGGLTYAKFVHAVRPLELTYAQRIQLFEGLQTSGRKPDRTGRLHGQDLKFLTSWDAERELRDGKAWMSLIETNFTETVPVQEQRSGGLTRRWSLEL